MESTRQRKKYLYKYDPDDDKYGTKSSLVNGPVPWILLCTFMVASFVVMFYLAEGASLTTEEHLQNLQNSGAIKLRHKEKEIDSPIKLGSETTEFDENVIATSDASIPVGWVKKPTIPSTGTPSEDDGRLHIIFSSGCNYFQHWQSEFLLATAHLVGQRGRITRIVSGCHDKSAEQVKHSHQTFPSGKNDLLVPVEELLKSVNPDFGLYITPSFVGAKDFPWINKPSSIRYFSHHAREELDKAGETVIAILDPDFVFMKPLTQTGSAPDDIIQSRGPDGKENNPPDVVKKGRPVAQRYGLEGGWVSMFDIAKITGNKNSPSLSYSRKEAAKYFSVGPPLMLHIDDLASLSVLWEKYMRPVLDQDKDILADMWAYCMAAADLGLRHTILDHYMISTWGSHGQAFQWVDEWKEMSCNEPPNMPDALPLKSPTFIHLASNFKAPESKEWMFHKGHVPPDILSCDSPMIKESPDDLFNISPHDSSHRNQHAWILCNTVSRLNKVLYMYKEKYCPKGYESRKLVRLIQSKTKDRGCNQKTDKWCYPLAQIEDLPNDWRKY